MESTRNASADDVNNVAAIILSESRRACLSSTRKAFIGGQNLTSRARVSLPIHCSKCFHYGAAESIPLQEWITLEKLWFSVKFLVIKVMQIKAFFQQIYFISLYILLYECLHTKNTYSNTDNLCYYINKTILIWRIK